MDSTTKRALIAIAVFFVLLLFFKNSLGEIPSFILGLAAAYGVFKFYKIEDGPIPDTLPPPPPVDEATIDGAGLGKYVVTFQKGTRFDENSATVKDIVKALGSNHPLENPSSRYSDEEKVSNQYWVNHFNESIRIDQFGGHLNIGGHLFWDGQGHILTVGGARSGKGSCLIIPALTSVPIYFDNAPSFICLDPKGENLAITGAFLKRAGYNVVCINPFGIPEIAEFGQSGFNVFETFSAADPDFDKYADMIANAIVVSTKTSNSHFDKTSRAYISLYIRHLMSQDEDPKNFRTLYKWLRLGGDDRMNFLEKMGKNPAFDGDIADEAFAIHSQIASGANKEVESTYSTIRAATDSFKSQQLRDSISRTDFDIKQIAHEKTALFVCMNPSDLEDNQAWLRILFGSFIRSLTKNYSKTRKVVMLMDEFPTMGYFREFEIMSGFMAGYNVTLWPIMQDLTQLKSLYPNTWETFINNAIVRHFLSVGDNFTADYIAKRMPVVEWGGKENRRYDSLLTADKVLSDEDITVFINGVKKPAFFYKKPYWEIPFTRKEVAPNPFR